MAAVIVPTMKPLVKALMRAINPFSPLSLFASGEEGAWYDPSDLTTLYQYDAGTTPVTADGDPVGLILDKSKGLVLGAEVVGDPSFDDPAYWTTTTNVEITGGAAVYTNTVGTGEYALRAGLLSAGSVYAVTVVVDSLSAGGELDIGSASGGYIYTITSAGTYSFLLMVKSGGNLGLQAATAGTSGVISSISVKELPGNHASQSVAASRRLYRADGTLHWMQDDLTDDALTAALPDLGTDATLAYADASGVTILTGQTISGDTDLPTTAETYGVIYLDRAFTDAETDNVTSYLNSLRGA